MVQFTIHQAAQMQPFVGLHSKMGHEIIRFNSFIFFYKEQHRRGESDEDKGRSALLLRWKLFMELHPYQL